MNQYPIFISSSDAYFDLWPIFFDLFKKYWPEFDGLIYLNTEHKEFYFEGLNIICTHVGSNSFGKTFRAGLDKVDSPYLLLIMIDYFFMEKVKNELMNDYFVFFKAQCLDSLCLIAKTYKNILPLKFKDVYKVIPPSQDMFNYQIAFWNKTTLYQMVLPHETPWLSEWYGTLRANQMNLKLAFTATEIPIQYLAEGALHKGKWVKPIVDFFTEISYSIDYTQRGLFDIKPDTYVKRGRSRLITFIPRVLSNLDLFKRKWIKVNE